jgi:hypothetical protein
MPPQFRRFDKIIARRRNIHPKQRASHLKDVGYQLDGITDLLPTTETPYQRTSFIYDTYPIFWDIPALDNEINNENRKVKFGTITEYPLDNLPPPHPSGTFPATDYRDWNLFAPTLLEFIEFANLPWDDNFKKDILAEYWITRNQATLTTNELNRRLEALQAEEEQAAPPVEDQVLPNAEEEDTTTIANVSDQDDHPTDEDTTSSSEDETSTPTPPKRRRYFDHYVEGPCVSCTISPHFPGIELNTGRYGHTYFTHLDTSGHQFDILPGVDYHFNDVTVSLTENRTGLEILAICPEVVDVSNLPDNTENPTEPTHSTVLSPDTTATRPHKRKTYTTSSARTYNLRPHTYPRSPHTGTTDNNTSTSSLSSTSDDTPPPSFYDRDYNPSDNDTDEEELIIDTTDSATSTDNESLDDSSYSTDHSTNHLNRTTYGLRSSGENWQQHIQEAVRNISLSVPETIDLTASDTEDDTTCEAGDIIVLSETI